MMDIVKLAEVFKSTLDGNYNQAEKQLEQVINILSIFFSSISNYLLHRSIK